LQRDIAEKIVAKKADYLGHADRLRPRQRRDRHCGDWCFSDSVSVERRIEAYLSLRT
jgi:hypothetical protein